MFNRVQVRLIVACCVVVVLAGCSREKNRNVQTSSDTAIRPQDVQNLLLTDTKVKEFLASLKGESIPGATEYKPQGPHKLLILSSTKGTLDWQDQMPTSWTPKTLGEVEVVAIVHEPERKSAEMPNAGLVDSQGREVRSGSLPEADVFVSRIEIREALSGRLLIEKVIRGSGTGYRPTGPGPDIPNGRGGTDKTAAVAPTSGSKPTFKDASLLFDQAVNGQYVNGRLEFKPTTYAGTWVSKNGKGQIFLIKIDENSLPSKGDVSFDMSTKLLPVDVYWVPDTGQTISPDWHAPAAGKIKLVDGLLSGQIAFPVSLGGNQKVKVISFSGFNLCKLDPNCASTDER